jgi:SAM-dependent methyltransferase
MTEIDDAMGTVMRLGIAAEALAALGARLRAGVEEIELDGDVAAGLDEVVDRLGVDVAAMTAEERRRIAMSAQALLLQAADLLGDPGRPPGWAFEDPAVLLSTGWLSAGIAGVISEVAPALDGLQDALQRDGAVFLDVGAGVAALSIALCETWPGLRVVALEPWRPALALAEAQVESSGVGQRIELRAARVEDLRDEAAFDAAWLAGPFVPPPVLPVALTRLRLALKPGAWVLLGRFGAPPDPLARAVTRLRVLRSGGSVADAEALSALMREAGFEEVHEVQIRWQAPAFTVGRRPLLSA